MDDGPDWAGWVGWAVAESTDRCMKNVVVEIYKKPQACQSYRFYAEEVSNLGESNRYKNIKLSNFCQFRRDQLKQQLEHQSATNETDQSN